LPGAQEHEEQEQVEEPQPDMLSLLICLEEIVFGKCCLLVFEIVRCMFFVACKEREQAKEG
jgi:hypothetical protein